MALARILISLIADDTSVVTPETGEDEVGFIINAMDQFPRFRWLEVDKIAGIRSESVDSSATFPLNQT